jgi:dihydrofolate reductase
MTRRNVVLIYSMIMSLDGYTTDTHDRFDWAKPDEEVLAFLNDQERGVGTYLYGRRMYEAMRYWETADLTTLSPGSRDFATFWRDADKIVYSTTLGSADTARTRVEPRFDPEVVRALKQRGDVNVSGPSLAASAVRAGLVDEYQLFIAPVVVGGGTRFFPEDVNVELELTDQRRFVGGFTYLNYRALPA